MIARVLEVDVAPERMDALVAAYREVVRPVHAEAAGLLRHYVLLDRDTGCVRIIGVWASEEALAEVAPRLDHARDRLWATFESEPRLGRFEVADVVEHPLDDDGP